MEAILRDIPDEFYTERLHLRTPRFGDGAIIHSAAMESLDDLRRWMPWAQGDQPVANYETFARRAVANFATRDQINMLIFLRDSGELIGTCGMHHIKWNMPTGEIGYWLRSGHTGRGLMTEAVIGWTQYAWMIGMQRVEIRCNDRNLRSARVAERAGYRLDGVLRNEARDTAGDLCDTRVYSLIAAV